MHLLGQDRQDNDSFAEVVSKKNFSPRVAKWMMRLEDYNYSYTGYTIEAGTRMRLVRYPFINLIDHTLLGIRKAQDYIGTINSLKDVK